MKNLAACTTRALASRFRHWVNTNQFLTSVVTGYTSCPLWYHYIINTKRSVSCTTLNLAHKLSTFSSASHDSLLPTPKHRAGLPSRSLGLSHLDGPQCVTGEPAIHLSGQLCHSPYRIRGSYLKAGNQVYTAFP